MQHPHAQQINSLFDANIQAVENARALAPQIVQASVALANCLNAGGKILICGNGGSAADSIHFSAELLNKFYMVRRPLAAISLATDIATLTSIGNDESYDAVFSKQVEALGKSEDILVAISTSGNSANVIKAVESAHQQSMKVVTLSGKGGGQLSCALNKEDIDIVVPDDVTARIQEVHGIIIHAFCQFIDQQLFGDSSHE